MNICPQRCLLAMTSSVLGWNDKIDIYTYQQLTHHTSCIGHVLCDFTTGNNFSEIFRLRNVADGLYLSDLFVFIRSICFALLLSSPPSKYFLQSLTDSSPVTPGHPRRSQYLGGSLIHGTPNHQSLHSLLTTGAGLRRL